MDWHILQFSDRDHDIANWLGKPHFSSPPCLLLLLLDPQAKVNEMEVFSFFFFRLTVDKLNVVYWQPLFNKNTADGAPLAFLTTCAAMHGENNVIITSANLLCFKFQL